MKFACMNGHVLIARDAEETDDFDLEGCVCPLCMGAVKGHQTMIVPFILAPMQDVKATANIET